MSAHFKREEIVRIHLRSCSDAALASGIKRAINQETNNLNTSLCLAEATDSISHFPVSGSLRFESFESFAKANG